MNRYRFAPLAIAVLILATGLVLGAGKGDDDTSIANTLSKVLLTAGSLAIVVSVVVLLIRLQRSRRRAS